MTFETVIDGRPAVVEHYEQPSMLPPATTGECLDKVRIAVQALDVAKRAAKKATKERAEASERLEEVVEELLQSAERDGTIEMRLPFIDEALAEDE